MMMLGLFSFNDLLIVYLLKINEHGRKRLINDFEMIAKRVSSLVKNKTAE